MQSHRTLGDWALLFALVAMWGSAFMFNKLGVATVAPATLVAIRVAVGALTLIALLYARGLRLPPFGKIWLAFVVMGLVGNAIPFYLITWGQQVVESAVAGMLMAVMPLATLVLAHFLVQGERLSTRRVIGFALGFAGIVLLMAPAAPWGTGGWGADLVSQLAILFGALCYATNSVLARLLIKSDFIVAATGTLLVASAAMLPIALLTETPWRFEPSLTSLIAITWLGIGATGFATIVYFRLISSAGPTFMSLVNYLSPAVAVLLGVMLLGEKPDVNAYTGLVLILSGIGLTQWRRHR